MIRSSSGNWSILKSPVCSTSPAAVRIATARPSGIEWLTATNSQSNGPNRVPVALRHLAWSPGVIRCSLSLAVDERQRQLRADHGDVARARGAGTGTPPMWSSCPWVRTIASILSSRSRIQVKSGRITSTPGWCLLGEQHAAVDDEQLAGVLEDGHVATDLAEPAERRRRAGRPWQRRRRAELGMRMAHVVSPLGRC